MLVSINKNNVSVNDVVIVKLINGDELIGKLTAISDDKNTYTFDTPVCMQMMPMGNGQAQVVFAPFLLGIDDGTQVEVDYAKMLIRPMMARSDAAKQYLSATSKLDLSATTSI